MKHDHNAFENSIFHAYREKEKSSLMLDRDWET